MNIRKRAAWLLPLSLVSVGWFARGVAARALESFFGYETPFAFSRAGVEPTLPLTPRMVVVLADGLGVGPSRDLPFLNELRQRGADFTARVGLPSLSQPGRAVIFTGAWQEVHGQTTNFRPRPLRVEHLFQTARRRGLGTTLAAGEGTHKLVRPYVSDPVVYPDEPETAPFSRYEEDLGKAASAVRALLHDHEPAFAFVDFHIVDDAGHGWGARSEEYRRAAHRVDEEIRSLASSLDLSRSTLVVTSDHGHVPEGGHGGPEEPVMDIPLVMAGAGVVPGTSGRCQQVDVAPTLAVLLGVEIPAANQGRPLLEALSLGRRHRLQVLHALVLQRQAFVSRYVAVVRHLDSAPGPESLPADGWPAAAPGAGGHQETERALQAQLLALERTATRAKNERIALETRLRSRDSALMVLLPLAVLGALLALRVVGVRELRLACLASAAGALLYHALLPVAGLRYSITAVNKDEWLPFYFQKDMALGVATCALAVLAACAWRARRRASLLSLARLSWLVSAAYCFVFVVKLALVYWRQGVFFRWHIPDLYWGFGFYLDLVVVMAVGFASVAMPALAWLASRLARPPAASADAASGARAS